MTNKERQIVEMAKIIENAFKVYFGANDLIEPEDFPYQAKDLAKELLKHYQPKLPEDSVVLSREGYKLLFDIKKKFETVDGDEITTISLLMWLKELTAQARKETAKKFYTLLKKKGTVHTEFDWNDYLQIDIDDLDKLAKQFGVDIDEKGEVK